MMKMASFSSSAAFWVFAVITTLMAQQVELNSWTKGGEKVLVQEIIGMGFHRVMKYHILMEETGNCNFMIQQSVPAYMYVDLDEVKNLESFGGCKVLADQYFDTEKPSYEANSQVITAYPKEYSYIGKTLTFNISMPVHLRYQRPTEDGKITTLKLESGSLYSHCNERAVKGEIIEEICHHTSKKLCEWSFIQRFQEANGALVLQLPTGNLSCTMIVTTTTLLATTFACLIIVFQATKA